jgi:peptidoglycan/LPS O-acetylase OafA/YrhL
MNMFVASSAGNSLRARADNLPSLDGMRAISILLVLLSHANISHLIPGYFGVVVFFVISGFLISRLMIAEIASTGTLNIQRFYTRRMLRLFPTLLLMIAVFTPVLRALGATITPVHVASAAFYLANYYDLFIGYPAHSPFPTLWSLAVEEHFYIVFPFVVWCFRQKPKGLLPWLTVAALAVLVWRVYLNAACNASPAPFALCGLTEGWARIYKGTDSIIDCIIIGALASFAVDQHPRQVRRWLLNGPAFWIGAATLLLTLVVRNLAFRETLRYSVQCCAIAVVVLNVLFGNTPRLRRILESRVLVVVGRWSYALYVYHFAVIMVIELVRNRPGGLDGGFEVSCFLLGTFTLAGLTYHYVELPLKALRQRLRAGMGGLPA